MTTGSLMQDYRSPHVQLPERSRKAPSLKWKWSKEGELEVELRKLMVKIAWHRHLSCTRVRDDAMQATR